MDILTSATFWIVVAILVGISLGLQVAFEGLILALGSAIVWVFSGGRIKVGESRDLIEPSPKLGGGAVFYYENSHWFVYRNYAVLIGLVAVLSILAAIVGIGINVSGR